MVILSKVKSHTRRSRLGKPVYVKSYYKRSPAYPKKKWSKYEMEIAVPEHRVSTEKEFEMKFKNIPDRYKLYFYYHPVRKVSDGWFLDPKISSFAGDLDTKGTKTYNGQIVYMDADDFLRMQYEASDCDCSYREWLEPFYRESKLDMIRELHKRKQLHIPFIEFNKDGTLRHWQEGRHRGLFAKERGEQIPVMIYQKKDY